MLPSTLNLLRKTPRSVLRRSLATSASTPAASTPAATREKSTRTGRAPRRILVTGGTGQIGMELVPYLRELFGQDAIVNSDIRTTPGRKERGPFAYCDVRDKDALARIVLENGVDTVLHMASLLSAVGEKNPQLALDVNTRGLQNVLDLAHQHNLSVFAPSTIAVFGPSTPQDNTPDEVIMRPTTMYDTP